MRPLLLSTGHFVVWSAPVFAGLAALAAFLYLQRHRSRLARSSDAYWGLLLALAVGVVLGSVAVYFLAYGGGAGSNLDFVRRRRTAPGGSFLGAFWGAAAAAWLYSRRAGLPAAAVADVLGAAAPLGLVVMRVGCVLNGCCYGKPTAAPWGLAFTERLARVPSSLRGVPLHPTQLYEAAGCAALFWFLHRVALPRTQSGAWRAGSAFALSVALYAALRFVVDFLRGSDPGVLTPAGLTTAQLTSLAALAGAAAWARRA